MAKSFTYSGTLKIARLDGADIKDIQVGNTVRAIDEIDAEAICHIESADSVEKVFPGYRILQFPTIGNGMLTLRAASDAAWS